MPAASAANQRIAHLAAQRNLHRAFHWLHLHQPQLRQWQIETAAIPAPPFEEAERAAWFLERFRSLGLDNVHLDPEGNALAELAASPSASGEPPLSSYLLLSAHLDTVFPAGTDCVPTDLRGSTRILGPGICDNAAGLTALLGIAAALRFAGIVPPVPILFAANVGEEGEGNLRGMRFLFERGPYAHRIAAAIALEGSGTSSVVTRALGSLRFRLTATGPGGHSWTDAGTPNPIVTLSRAIAALADLPLPSAPRTTFNVGSISGGTSVNSIPQSATALIDLRSDDGAELRTIEAAVQRTVATLMSTLSEQSSASRTAKWPETLLLELIGNRPAASLPPESPLLQTLRAVDRHLGLTTQERIGSTDANIPLSLNLPALAIGCGGTGGGIHTLQEWYDPAGREIALRRILLLLLDTAQLLTAQHSATVPFDRLPE